MKMHLLLSFNNLPGDLEDSIENEGSKLCGQTYYSVGMRIREFCIVELEWFGLA